MAPDITQISENVVESRGQNVTLRCRGTGDAPLNVSWVTPSGEVHSVLTSHAGLFCEAEGFVVTIFSDSDGGSYTCTAENEGGTTNSSLVVYVTPYFTHEPLDVFATNGSFQNVTCRAGAFPPPEYAWVAVPSSETASFIESLFTTDASSGSGESNFFSGSGNGDYVSYYLLTENETLVADPVTFGDEGFVYWCFVYNDFGLIYATINVTGKIILVMHFHCKDLMSL